MVELQECKSSQDKKMQGTCTEGSVRTSDMIISDIVQVRDIRHVPLESKQYRKNASIPRVECSIYFSVRGEHAKDREQD